MCCGKNREQFRSSPNLLGSTSKPALRQQVEPTRRDSVSFEYIGQTSLVVVGPATGRQYNFERTGARVSIDPRDRPWVASMRALRQVPSHPIDRS